MPKGKFELKRVRKDERTRLGPRVSAKDPEKSYGEGRIKRALWERVPCDHRGYVTRPEDNLLPGIRMDMFEADLLAGAGRELYGKFRAVHSSSALAVNSFAPWKDRIEDLEVCGFSGFQSLLFERKCYTGLKGTPPTLDVFLASHGLVLGIESKFLEPLTRKPPKFSPSYGGVNTQDGWKELVSIYGGSKARRLDVAQLIKHGLGLLNIPCICKKVLLYLYWVPDGEAPSEYQQHEREIEEFKQHLNRMAGRTNLSFMSMTYPALWESWEKHEHMRGHVANLRNRYCISL